MFSCSTSKSNLDAPLARRCCSISRTKQVATVPIMRLAPASSFDCATPKRFEAIAQRFSSSGSESEDLVVSLDDGRKALFHSSNSGTLHFLTIVIPLFGVFRPAKASSSRLSCSFPPLGLRRSACGNWRVTEYRVRLWQASEEERLHRRHRAGRRPHSPDDRSRRSRGKRWLRRWPRGWCLLPKQS